MKTKWLHITLDGCDLPDSCGSFRVRLRQDAFGDRYRVRNRIRAPDDQTGGDAVAYYFYDADADEEYFIMLGKGTDKVTFAVKNTVKTGTYRLEGTSLSMSDGNGWSQTASRTAIPLSLTYEGAEYRFLEEDILHGQL